MKTFVCLNCNGTFPHGKNTFGKYCSNSCQMTFQSNQKLQKWLNGEDKGWTGKTRQLKKFIREYLLKERGTACSQCGWDEKHKDGSILTEIDHIDGDAENCKIENLRILCPNCHALTDTFRVRNKNSKRER